MKKGKKRDRKKTKEKISHERTGMDKDERTRGRKIIIIITIHINTVVNFHYIVSPF